MKALVVAARRWARPLKRLLAGPPEPFRLFGYDRYLRKPRSGRALLSYVPEPVRDELNGDRTTSFSNQGIANAIPRALNELGYVVDIVSWDDIQFRPRRRYDLLVQHGGANFAQLSAGLRSSVPVVYFSTGNYWRLHNALSERRSTDFERRHGIRRSPDRWIAAPEEEALLRADGIIALGSDWIRESYGPFPHVFPIDIGVFPPERHVDRDLAAARDHVLFFSGPGNLHKGLDLALEAFAGLAQHLHVVTWIDPDFIAVFEPLLRQSPNIHVHGHIPLRSDRFYELVSTCAFAIAPTASDGQPGSLLECINNGLIPLATREAHLDVTGFGRITEGSVDAIRAAVGDLVGLDLSELARMSEEARRVAAERHSPERFVSTMTAHLAAVLELAAARTVSAT